MHTFHPKFSKKVHNRDCPVVFPPQGPVMLEEKYCCHETCELLDVPSELINNPSFCYILRILENLDDTHWYGLQINYDIYCLFTYIKDTC